MVSDAFTPIQNPNPGGRHQHCFPGLGFAAKDKPLAGIFRIMQPWRNTW
jgi:hypothetical protein